MGLTDLRTAFAAAALLGLAACAPTHVAGPNEGPGAAFAAAPPAAPGKGATAAPAVDANVAGSRASYANPGFEAPAISAGDLEGWQMSQHAGVHSYDFDLDKTVKHGRSQSLRITNVGPEPYGAVYQVIPADALRGRTVEFSGWLRTANASGDGAQLTLIARASGAILTHQFLNDPGVTGTQDWQRYSVRLKVPANTERLEFGAMLVGPGTLWFDDTMLTVVR